MLWRVPAYSEPGLPRPTISQSTGAPRAGPATCAPSPTRRRSPPPLGGLAVALGAGLARLALADELGLLLDLGLVLDLEPRRAERRDHGLGIVDQRDARRAR